MTHTKKSFLYSLFGLLAALTAWPLMELLAQFQTIFPSMLLYSLASGALLGCIFGLIIGSGEGIVTAIRPRVIKGALTGAVLGIAGGLLGFLLGQAVVLLLSNSVFTSNEDIRRWSVPVSRAIGWSVIGICVSLTEGIRARSLQRSAMGIIGGIVGGVAGALVFEAARYLSEAVFIARLFGLAVMGLGIGLVFSLIERALAVGVLRILNGKLKAKEYVISSKRVRIGNSEKNDIILPGYAGVAPQHAHITLKQKGAVITPLQEDTPVFVNEQKQDSRKLKWEDVIKIGSAKFLFKTV